MWLSIGALLIPLHFDILGSSDTGPMLGAVVSLTILYCLVKLLISVAPSVEEKQRGETRKADLNAIVAKTPMMGVRHSRNGRREPRIASGRVSGHPPWHKSDWWRG